MVNRLKLFIATVKFCYKRISFIQYYDCVHDHFPKIKRPFGYGCYTRYGGIKICNDIMGLEVSLLHTNRFVDTSYFYYNMTRKNGQDLQNLISSRCVDEI